MMTVIWDVMQRTLMTEVAWTYVMMVPT